MATTTITGLTAVTAGNLTGAAVLEVEDSNGDTRKSSLATLRTKMFAGGTGYTAADPLTCGAVTASDTVTATGTAGNTGGAFKAIGRPATNDAYFRIYRNDGTTLNAFFGADNANFYIGHGAGVVGQFDEDATAGNTRFLVYCVDTGTVSRVKTGASGTGPGGAGRALYV